MVTGRLPLVIPYISHKRVPAVKRAYIDKEIPEVFFVWIVLIACGKKDTVVPKAANNPIMVVMFMDKILQVCAYVNYYKNALFTPRLKLHK
jgi:hypothetical protein